MSCVFIIEVVGTSAADDLVTESTSISINENIYH